MQKIYYHVTVWHVRGIVILKVLLVPNKKSASRHVKMTNEFTLPDVRVSKCSVPFKLRLRVNGNIGRHQFVKFPLLLPHLRPRPQPRLRPLQPPPLKNRLKHPNGGSNLGQTSQRKAKSQQEKFNIWDTPLRYLMICVIVFRESQLSFRRSRLLV